MKIKENTKMTKENIKMTKEKKLKIVKKEALKVPVKKVEKKDIKPKLKNEVLKNGVTKNKVIKKKVIKNEVKKDKVIKNEVNENKVTKNEVDKDNKQVDNLECSKLHVTKCVKAVLKLAQEDKEKQKELLSDFNNPIFLQITAIKIPETPTRTARLYLPHSMVGENDEVALFVPDLKKGLRQDYEKTVDHWETILREQNVTSIKDVIPMNRVKTEYRQFESKLKLGRLYDYFLVDGRIDGHLTHLLGRTFLKVGKKPIPVKLSRSKLKGEIENSLKKTNLEIHGRGNTHTVQVASITMETKDIIENVLAAFEEIKKNYPGGLLNIRSIFIKTKKGLGIPIYYSMVNKNKVPVPKVQPLRPKSFKVVEGELSTLNQGPIVSVTPTGKVQIKKNVKSEAMDVADESSEGSC